MSVTPQPRHRVLICTIMRNSRRHLERWTQQLNDLHVALMGEVDLEYSVYENDSIDGTAEWLDIYCPNRLGRYTTCAKLGTQQYGSIWSADRLANLAAARQECLNQVEGGLDRFDKICYIEVDVTYDPKWVAELILARHPVAAGLGEPDIYSGWSLRSESHPKESHFLFDTCATRQEDSHTEWRFDLADSWRGKSLVRTDLGGVDNNCLHNIWSTFNCFCVYNAKPFKEGLTWDYINRRLNTGQEWIQESIHRGGWLECDTVSICEAFRLRGYNKVYLNTNCLVRHA